MLFGSDIVYNLNFLSLYNMDVYEENRQEKEKIMAIICWYKLVLYYKIIFFSRYLV